MTHSPKPMSSQPDAEPPELEAFARFCGALVLEDGSRMSLEPFQRRMLRDFFGGTVETLILLPKKNGKSTLLGALGLFHLVTTPDAECVIGAASRDQATILYDQAAGFVRRSAGLEQRVHVKRGYREIQARRDSGRIRVLAADVDTADGVIPTLALVDELHRHKSAGLYGIFRDGLGPRRGRMITISTAGDSETSPLGLMRAKAHRLTRPRARRALLASSQRRRRLRDARVGARARRRHRRPRRRQARQPCKLADARDAATATRVAVDARVAVGALRLRPLDGERDVVDHRRAVARRSLDAASASCRATASASASTARAAATRRRSSRAG
jgi:hypothetical protein